VLTPPRIKKNNQDKIGLPSDKVSSELTPLEMRSCGDAEMRRCVPLSPPSSH